tara:strand:- start:39 stop:293 length:255 start_codon:yes stop_codon:yes gene_type:complete
MTPDFKVGDLVEYITYTDDFEESTVTAVIAGFYDYDTLEDLGNDYTTHDRVIAAHLLSNYGWHKALITEISILSSVDTELCQPC